MTGSHPRPEAGTPVDPDTLPSAAARYCAATEDTQPSSDAPCGRRAISCQVPR